MITETELQQLRERQKHIRIEWVRESGLRTELVEPYHVRLVMPMTAKHLNHVNIAYAGTEFVTIEMSAGAWFFASYGLTEYIPIVRNISIDYLRPTQKDLVADIHTTPEEAEEKMKVIREIGKGEMEVPVSLKDADGREVARAVVTFYVMPYTENFMRK